MASPWKEYSTCVTVIVTVPVRRQGGVSLLRWLHCDFRKSSRAVTIRSLLVSVHLLLLTHISPSPRFFFPTFLPSNTFVITRDCRDTRVASHEKPPTSIAPYLRIRTKDPFIGHIVKTSNASSILVEGADPFGFLSQSHDSTTRSSLETPSWRGSSDTQHISKDACLERPRFRQ